MKHALFFLIFFSIAGFGQIPESSVSPSKTTSNNAVQRLALADLDMIYNIFTIKYAPLQWKEEYAKCVLEKMYQVTRARLASLQNPSLKDCQIVLRDFFNSVGDYHVGIHFYSTETAALPFTVKGASSRYFVSFVDRSVAPIDFPFTEGDEIISFGGNPVDKVVKELKVKEFGNNSALTDQSLAELLLTQRDGALGQKVPSGSVPIVGKRKSDGKQIISQLTWNYSPEQIRDFAKLKKLNGILECKFEELNDSNGLLKNSPFFEKLMVANFWKNTSRKSNPHEPGARTSFLPPLGTKIWKTSQRDFFDAYLFQSPAGKRIGYIRIPHYIGDEEEVEEFGEIMDLFEKETDGLIIDQINNPGGSLFYVYGLAAILANTPLEAPKHHIALTQEEVALALSLLSPLEQIVDDSTARLVIGETLGGYPVDYEFAQSMKAFCQFIVDQWGKGRLLTDPIFVFGVKTINPHPQYRYTKPILCLINELDFSAGDFFPAILQDNKRAVLFGTRTSGAGGYVIAVSYPNHTGIRRFSLTGSFAKRLNQKPIENLGVEPDIRYAPTVDDVKGNYDGYVKELLKAVDELLATP